MKKALTCGAEIGRATRRLANARFLCRSPSPDRRPSIFVRFSSVPHYVQRLSTDEYFRRENIIRSSSVTSTWRIEYYIHTFPASLTKCNATSKHRSKFSVDVIVAASHIHNTKFDWSAVHFWLLNSRCVVRLFIWMDFGQSNKMNDKMAKSWDEGRVWFYYHISYFCSNHNRRK